MEFQQGGTKWNGNTDAQNERQNAVTKGGTKRRDKKEGPKGETKNNFGGTKARDKMEGQKKSAGGQKRGTKARDKKKHR